MVFFLTALKKKYVDDASFVDFSGFVEQ